MYTGCFKDYKGYDGVNISLKPPEWFRGPSYPDLFPKWSFLKKYFADGNKNEYTTEYYNQILSKLDPSKVYKDLQHSVLLCWCLGNFCHRYIVADWIFLELGICINEYSNVSTLNRFLRK